MASDLEGLELIRRHNYAMCIVWICKLSSELVMRRGLEGMRNSCGGHARTDRETIGMVRVWRSKAYK